MKLYQFIDAQKDVYDVAELCENLDVTRSGYYAWRKSGGSKRARSNERLKTQIVAIHRESERRYGSPRIHAELVENGHVVGENRVARLMRVEGIRAMPRKRFRVTTDSKHNDPKRPDRAEPARAQLHRESARRGVGRRHHVHLDERGWCYLAVLIDLYSRRVVGWSLKETLSRELALQALTNALRLRRPAPGLIHHTDRGCQYASGDYRRMLSVHGVRASMSRRANCWDNAVAESFFATLKKELVHGCAFQTRTEAYDVISNYIENFYNAKRRHSTIGNISPNTKEQTAIAKAAKLTKTLSIESGELQRSFLGGRFYRCLRARVNLAISIKFSWGFLRLPRHFQGSGPMNETKRADDAASSAVVAADGRISECWTASAGLRTQLKAAK